MTIQTLDSFPRTTPPVPHSGMASAVLAPELSAEETRVLDRLGTIRPDLLPQFLHFLRSGRRGVLLRLLQAAIRENMAGALDRSSWMDGGTTLVVRLFRGRSLRISVSRRMALDRFEADGELILVDRGQSSVVDHPGELLDLLAGEELAGDGDLEAKRRLERLRYELDNSSTNLILSLVGAARRTASLRRWGHRLGLSTSLQHAAVMKRLDASFSPLAFFEQCVVSGHPLHPGCRMKLGMEPEDVMQYAPEWGARPDLALVAVARGCCRTHTREPEGPTQILLREHPQAGAVVAAELSRMGRSLADYELVPVHPWQLRHTLPRLYAEPIRRGDVIPIPKAVIPAQALISVRSFAPVQRQGEGKHHLKTAIDVHMTSAVRTVSPFAVENGPRLSSLLDRIRARELYFRGTLVPLSEDAGIHYLSADSELEPELAAAQAKHLAAIVRENPENHVNEGEIAMPAAALTADSPLSGRPIVAELIEAYGASTGCTAPQAASAAFVARYAEVSVPGMLTLMCQYGIALEGHMQNSVTVFRDGEPVRMLVRDLGAVRIWPERLEQQGLSFTAVPGSAILARNQEDLRNKLYYSFFQNHLAELIHTIARHYRIDEGPLWARVACVARRELARLKSRPELSTSVRADEEALFQAKLALKALTTMRLKGDVTEYTYREVANPLFSPCLSPGHARLAEGQSKS